MMTNCLIWQMMGNCRPVFGDEEIVITGQVLADGRGDWAAIRHIQKCLQKKFPDRIVRIIASSAQKWEGALDTSKIKALDLVFYQNSENEGINVPLNAFDINANIIDKVQKAGVVISAGVDISSVFESVFDEIHEKCIKIKEHDFSTAIRSAPLFGKTRLQTGLDTKGDRLGIFIAKDKQYTWDNLSCPHLKSLLKSSHSLFFGYLSNQTVCKRFIRDALVFAETHLKDKSIDICMVGLSTLQLPYEYLESIGYGSALFISFNGDKIQEQVVRFANGKQLRVIIPTSLTPKDFKILMSLSAPLVGCRGDDSLALALSFGKIPCYENRFESKTLGLLHRIEAQFTQNSSLYQYCKEGNAALPGLAEQAKQLGLFVRKNMDFNPILRGIVNERLLREKDPDFAARIDILREGNLPEEELKIQFNALLLEKQMLVETHPRSS